MRTEELTNLDSRQLLTKLDEIRQSAMKLGYEFAEATQKYKDLKELMPSILAEFQRSCFVPGMTMSEARMRALSDKNYQERIKEMNVAEYKASLKEVEYKGWMKSLEALQSIGYVRNQEMKLARS